MFTIYYEGFWIHGYCDRSVCRVPPLGTFKSLHAAKCAITKAVKQHNAAMLKAVPIINAIR